MSNHHQASISQPLQERTALLVIGGLVALVLALTACGGGDETSDATGSPTPTPTASTTPTPTPSAPLPAVTDFAPELDFFGDLAAVHSRPITATFDSAADSLSLADGATIEVPEGAFPAATELSVAIIDLLFENYLTNPPEARIYVLSTKDDVVLGAPLVLEVPKPADSVNVTRLVDGEWLPVDVPAGPTTRVEIAHFSNQLTLIGDIFLPSSEDQLWKQLDRPRGLAQGSTGSDFLGRCTKTILLYFKVRNFVTIQVAVSACAQALAESGYLDQGDEISLDCVVGKMEEGNTFDEAADACTPEQNATQSPSPSPEPDADPDPAPDPCPDGGGGQALTQDPCPETPAPTMPEITASLSPRIADSSFTAGSCTERADFEPDLVECPVTFNVSLDYVTSGPDSSISCAGEGQGELAFATIGGIETVDLSSLEGVATVSPVGLAYFNEASNPQFSSPVFVECLLFGPLASGGSGLLASVKFTFDLTSTEFEIGDCFPSDHPHCGPP